MFALKIATVLAVAFCCTLSTNAAPFGLAKNRASVLIVPSLVTDQTDLLFDVTRTAAKVAFTASANSLGLLDQSWALRQIVKALEISHKVEGVSWVAEPASSPIAAPAEYQPGTLFAAHANLYGFIVYLPAQKPEEATSYGSAAGRSILAIIPHPLTEQRGLAYDVTRIAAKGAFTAVLNSGGLLDNAWALRQIANVLDRTYPAGDVAWIAEPAATPITPPSEHQPGSLFAAYANLYGFVVYLPVLKAE